MHVLSAVMTPSEGQYITVHPIAYRRNHTAGANYPAESATFGDFSRIQSINWVVSPSCQKMSSKYSISGPVKAPLGSYPKLWRLLDHHFLKEDVPDRAAVTALDTIVTLNDTVLQNPKSANARAIRSSEKEVRNLVEMGATDILTEVGWTFKISRMEECWVLPYDADLEKLRLQQDKIVETQQKLKQRYQKSLDTTKFAAEKDRADKLAIIKQIEHDKAERDHRNALKAGAPPKPTQSLDEIRKQAVKERLERERLKKAKVALEDASPKEQEPTSLPGSFPSESRLVSGDTLANRGSVQGEEGDDSDEAYQAPSIPSASSHRPRSSKSRSGTTPIAVKPPVIKERYTATQNRLGGATEGEEHASAEPADEAMVLDRDDLLPSDEEDDE